MRERLRKTWETMVKKEVLNPETLLQRDQVLLHQLKVRIRYCSLRLEWFVIGTEIDVSGSQNGSGLHIVFSVLPMIFRHGRPI